MIKRNLLDSAFLAMTMATMKHTLITWNLREQAIELDMAIHHFSNGGGVQKLKEDMEQHDYLNKYNENWSLWLNTIGGMLEEYLTLPEEFINSSLRAELLLNYHDESERLNRRVDVEGFTATVNINQNLLSELQKSNEDFPFPVQLLGGEPIWTVGQAEEFDRFLKLRAMDSESIINEVLNAKINNDPTTQLQRMHFYEDILDGFNWTVDQQFQVAKYATNKMQMTSNIHIPEVNLYAGQVHISLRNWKHAKDFLQVAKQEFEKYYSDQLIGSNSYIRTLIQLGYVNMMVQREGLITENILSRAKDYTDKNEDDIGIKAFQSYKNGPVSFEKWFEENRRNVWFL